MPVRLTTARRPPVAVRPRKWKLLLALLAVGGALCFSALGENGLYRIWQKQQELEALEGQVARLEAENDSLRQVLWRLENDLQYVEKVAREEYGMSRPGERVYRLEEEP
jgi:cell division protein FtsB